jgi:hypothetical protein
MVHVKTIRYLLFIWMLVPAFANWLDERSWADLLASKPVHRLYRRRNGLNAKPTGA